MKTLIKIICFWSILMAGNGAFAQSFTFHYPGTLLGCPPHCEVTICVTPFICCSPINPCPAGFQQAVAPKCMTLSYGNTGTVNFALPPNCRMTGAEVVVIPAGNIGVSANLPSVNGAGCIARTNCDPSKSTNAYYFSIIRRTSVFPPQSPMAGNGEFPGGEFDINQVCQ